MKFCPSCGTLLPDDVELKFCPDCGAPLQLPEKKSPIASAGQVLIKVIIVLAGAVGLIILLCVILLVFILSTVEC